MDSFYEVPRNAPKPRSVETISTIPSVPEVSMLFEPQLKSNDNTFNDSVYLSYKAWKERSQNQIVTRPEVRDCRLNFQKQPQEPFARKKMQPFEEIYMANIPNRHLDLSIIEPPKVSPKKGIENINPNIQSQVKSPPENIKSKRFDAYDYETWRSKRDALDKFLTEDSNRSGVGNKNRIIDLYNYKPDHSEPKNFTTPALVNKENYMLNTTEPRCKCKDLESTSNQSNDFAMKDLLQIIRQQNEQILILQKQVATLINNKDTIKDRANTILFQDQCKTSTQVENKPPQFLPKKASLHQISLDVMTSFELSIRRPTNPKVYPQQSQICEITETESNNTVSENILDGIERPRDITLSLNAPQLRVPERCPTPLNSIKVDMKDYSSDDEEEPTCPEWTFYNNIMTQVNHILKKSGIRPSNTPISAGTMGPGDVIKQNMMKKVKETTIKHLKNIGVCVPPDNTDDFHLGNKETNNNSNEISFAVQQLLMKYLPNEYLAKVRGDQNNFHKPKQMGRIKRRPEFSMATVQYMQKYNLLNDNPNSGLGPMAERDNFDRILDTTAIRQQPKLL
ncbi:hypothetical protein RN001_006936 [Aquatica leii]|uniref:Uncharacterized protein n=1 Tax=Aquatica leii TaxID=1421715 RepID=A0AAN7PE54_9COLE|nr:hypothetical protein RN001_006936 [Aquatica leii]